MSWCKVDDQFADHPKFVGLSNDAVACWVRGLAYCNRHMTDGRIPVGAVAGLARHKRPTAVAAELVDARLWTERDGSYFVHDFLALNESREARERKKAEAQARKERWRNKRTGQFGDASENEDETQSGRVPERVPPRVTDAVGTQVSHPPEAEAEAEAKIEEIQEMPESRQKPPDRAPPDVASVFDAYLEGWRSKVGKGAEPKLTDGRKAKIRARLKEHPLEVVRKAAAGIWRSSWHVENGRTDFDLVVRDAGHVERFAGEHDRPTPNGSGRAPWQRPVQPGDGRTGRIYVPPTTDTLDEDNPF